MYGKVKLSKRQIKEDKFTSFMLSSKQQFQDNWQFYVIGVVVVILIIAGFVYFQNMKVSNELEAADIYSQGVAEFRQGNYQLSITSLNRVLDDFSGTESAEYATYLLGKANLETRNYTEAVRYFESYLTSFKTDKNTRAASLAGIATALENQGQYANAAVKFVEAFNENPDGPLVGDYLISSMRNYLDAGNTSQASTQLAKIEEMFAETDLAKRAQRNYTEKTLLK